MKKFVLSLIALAFTQSAFAGPFGIFGGGRNHQPQQQYRPQQPVAQPQPAPQPQVVVPRPVAETPVVPQTTTEPAVKAQALSASLTPLKLAGDSVQDDMKKMNLAALLNESVLKMPTLRVGRRYSNIQIPADKAASEAEFRAADAKIPKYPFESAWAPNPDKVPLTPAEFLMLEETNKTRRRAGLTVLLRPNQELMDKARLKSWNMAAYKVFSHYQSPAYSEIGNKYVNGQWSGGSRENIGWNYGSVSSAMTGWINSGGHYASIVSATAEFGGAVAISADGQPYWTQVFHTGVPK